MSSKTLDINFELDMLKYEFLKKVNKDITNRVTPKYNVFLFLTSLGFLYFVVN